MDWGLGSLPLHRNWPHIGTDRFPVLPISTERPMSTCALEARLPLSPARGPLQPRAASGCVRRGSPCCTSSGEETAPGAGRQALKQTNIRIPGQGESTGAARWPVAPCAERWHQQEHSKGMPDLTSNRCMEPSTEEEAEGAHKSKSKPGAWSQRR